MDGPPLLTASGCVRAQIADHLVALRVGQAEDVLQPDRDLGDVLLDVGPLLRFVGLAATLADVGGDATAALLQAEADLLDDLRVMGDRLLALRREGHPDAGDVDHEEHRPHGQGTPRLLELVGFPVRSRHRLRDRARALLVLERYPIRVAEHGDGGLGG
jgi:hypothetical protein